MTSPFIANAQIYGLLEVARLKLGPATTAMFAAAVASAQDKTGDDTRDAIGRALLLLQDASVLLLEADRICREASEVS
jgi:hypothetical protein